MTDINKIKKYTIAIGLTLMLAFVSLTGCSSVQAKEGSSSATVSSSQSHGSKGAPDGSKGKPSGGGSSANISYTGATTFSTDVTENGKTYESTTDSQQALLVSGGSSTISNATVTKSGEADGDEADFYGTNAAILSYNGGELTITNSNYRRQASQRSIRLQ